MGEVKVLMVAEKPSIADTLSRTLGQQVNKRKGVSPSSPVFEFPGVFKGRPAHFKVTGTTGHIFSLDFSNEYNDWNKHGPRELFQAETIRTYDARSRMPEHIEEEARGCDVLVLWLDCDREGENICFEVMGQALPVMARRWEWPGAYQGCVFRAHFSSLAAQDLIQAMENLSVPNENEAKAVDARQEIDLRVGVAFSRFQTQYFRQHFGRQLGKAMVTYGPCQTPTLWFCVKRHAEIQAFIPVPYWQLQASVSSQGGLPFVAQAERGSIWERESAADLKRSLQGVSSAVVSGCRTWQSSCRRPLPLNTVAMLQMASEELGIGPGDALHFAEQLYLKGITSYPRTETDKYPPNFDLEETLAAIHFRDAPWAEYARGLLDGGITAPREDGLDAGDHPPITPVRSATRAQCGGEAGWLLYQAICTRFLASISPDALFSETEVKLDLGSEPFTARSSRCVRRGWLDAEGREAGEEGGEDLAGAGLQRGAQISVQGVELMSHLTAPPRHLSESELLGLMETHGIGTDASMAQHVSNVCKRNYVELDESTRQMRPTPLGLALAHGFTLIDQELVLPSVRASIENACTRIAKGLARHAEVVASALRIFERKFLNYCRLVDRLPMMLAIAFSKEKGNAPAGGASAAYAEELWTESAKLIREVSLEKLQRRREEAQLCAAGAGAEEEEGAEAEAALAAEGPPGEGVLQAQRVLEELGFGPAGGAGGGGGGRSRRGPRRCRRA